MKTCYVCKEQKELEHFYSNGKGKNAYCKLCDHKRVAQWRRNNPEKRKDHVLKTNLKLRNNFTKEEYNTFLINQEFCCAICNRHLSEFKKKFAIDHCHKTGKIRGLLCFNCNTGIGHFRESIEAIENAIKYIQEHK